MSGHVCCLGLTFFLLAPPGGVAQSQSDGAAEVPKVTTNSGIRTVTFHVEVPDGTETLYLTGNRPEIGYWSPRVFALKGAGRERSATLRLPAGTQLEYKFTLGSWEHEALGPSGTVLPNHRLLVDADKEVAHVIHGFKTGGEDYITDWKGSGVLGRLEYWKAVPSRFLNANRNVAIWLPPDYDEDATNRYHVLYMHDGQNLFDPRMAFTGVDWGVDEAVVRCVKAGQIPPMIVVGVWSTEQRLREYSPWHQGTNYARFLIEELMPQVNQKFRTRTGPENTSVMGSSMGGLISFWLCWKRPDVFGRGGCVSSALTWNNKYLSPGDDGTALMEREIGAGATFPSGPRLYFDYGTKEGSASLEALHVKLGAWLLSQGWKDGEDFVVRKFPDAQHNESAWRARLDEPLKFLFSKGPQSGQGGGR